MHNQVFLNILTFSSRIQFKFARSAFSPAYGYILYQSIPGMIIPPGKSAGTFFDERIPHAAGKKKVQTPTPRASTNELKPHPRGIFLNYSLQKHEKMRQKSCKTARFYHLAKLGLQLSDTLLTSGRYKRMKKSCYSFV